MKETIIAFLISSIIVCGCNVLHAVKTQDSSELVALLSNPHQETRDAAAATLRELIATDPRSRTNDHGYEYWQKRAESVKPGMKHSDVMRLLPAYDHTLSVEQLIYSGAGTGQSHTAIWRLDHYWTVTIYYRNPDTVITRPRIRNKAMRIWVKPPANFTGTWVTWYVNGQKSHEIEYKNGKYHGTFITFYDNGQKCVQQHYRNGICSGSDSGWYSDGMKMYHGNYEDDKQTGTWTYWNPDGGVKTIEQRDEVDKK
jgi:hypothetical protein